MKISTANSRNYLELLDLWESSVRATHDFLTEKHIQHLKHQIHPHYFDAVSLHCVRNENKNIEAFIGIANQSIEMLFVSPHSFNQGIGTLLTQFAIKEFQVTTVDVNEQNPNALNFYLHMGFKIEKRSPLDGEGNPFPILHLTL